MAERKRTRLDWDDTRVFLEAYRQGSLVGAAQALGVSHSTVKRRLEAMQTTLGARLFTPTSEGLVPTDEGHAAYAAAERVEAAATAFEGRLSGARRFLSGSLVVTTVDALVEVLAPAIEAYTNDHPDVALTISTSNRILDLGRREADVAVRFLNAPDERLFGRKIARFEYAPFAAQSLASRPGPPEVLPWVLWDEAAGADKTDRWYAEWSGGRRPAVRVTDGAAMLSLVRSGQAGAAIPVPVGQAAGLTQIGDPIPGFGTDLWCLCHRDLRHADRVRRFIAAVAAALAT